MKILVFMGSPRKNGDTATLLKSFLHSLIGGSQCTS
jgi:multimeric flavodoxin WrbA